MDEVLSKQPTICDPAPGKARDAELAGRTGGARIVFDDVSFKYGDSAECVLENLDFACEPGQTTAIIGSTGSGKSTVVKLIERFYDVTCGSITVDGVDVRDVSQEALRAQLGYVPQKAFLFSGTIQSNIAYSDEGMPEERVELAAQVAQAADFIASKAEGLDAEVSQGGTNVSGGQRQRLAIARALATEARAYLFDDSFSALEMCIRDSALGILPEAPTDFIFCVLAEELGFFGVVVLLGLYLALVLVSFRIAGSAGDLFGLLIVMCVVGMWLFQILENIGMTCGLMPITGIPLPFMSYGSTGTIMNFIMLGLIGSVWAHNTATGKKGSYADTR